MRYQNATTTTIHSQGAISEKDYSIPPGGTIDAPDGEFSHLPAGEIVELAVEEEQSGGDGGSQQEPQTDPGMDRPKEGERVAVKTGKDLPAKGQPVTGS